MPTDLQEAFGWDRSSMEKGDPHTKFTVGHKYGLMGRMFDYWLYPDGTHCGYKIFVTTKTGFCIGLPLAFFNSIHQPVTKLGDYLKPFPARIIPLTATGFAFGTAACYSTALRGKDDDVLNYAFAGAASGAVFGALVKPGTFYGGPIVGFAIMAALYKYSKLCGLRWSPGREKGWLSGDFDSVSFMPDHSIGKDYGRLTGDEEWNIPNEKCGW